MNTKVPATGSDLVEAMLPLIAAQQRLVKSANPNRGQSQMPAENRAPSP